MLFSFILTPLSDVYTTGRRTNTPCFSCQNDTTYCLHLMFVAKERPYNQNNSDFQYCLKVQYDSPLPQTRSQASRRRHAEVDVADDAGAVVLAEEHGGDAVLQLLFTDGGLIAHVGIIAKALLFRLKVRVVGSGVVCAGYAQATSSIRLAAKINFVYNRIICRYQLPRFINLAPASYNPGLVVVKWMPNPFCRTYDLLVESCRLTKRLFNIGGIRSFELAHRIYRHFIIS